MKKRNELIGGILGMLFLCGTAAQATEVDTMGNLTETSSKISSIDMNNNFSDAGRLLDGFYSGLAAKKDLAPEVYAGAGSQRTLIQAEKEMCNAKAAKIGDLASKVPPLAPGDDNKRGNNGIPAGAGLLASGVVALAIASRKKGYFSNYGEDVHTVVDFITGGTSSSDNPNSPKDPYEPPSSTTSNPYAVHPSGGAVVCVDSSCGLP